MRCHDLLALVAYSGGQCNVAVGRCTGIRPQRLRESPAAATVPAHRVAIFARESRPGLRRLPSRPSRGSRSCPARRDLRVSGGEASRIWDGSCWTLRWGVPSGVRKRTSWCAAARLAAVPAGSRAMVPGSPGPPSLGRPANPERPSTGARSAASVRPRIARQSPARQVAEHRRCAPYGAHPGCTS